MKKGISLSSSSRAVNLVMYTPSTTKACFCNVYPPSECLCLVPPWLFSFSLQPWHDSTRNHTQKNEMNQPTIAIHIENTNKQKRVENNDSPLYNNRNNNPIWEDWESASRPLHTLLSFVLVSPSATPCCRLSRIQRRKEKRKLTAVLNNFEASPLLSSPHLFFLLLIPSLPNVHKPSLNHKLYRSWTALPLSHLQLLPLLSTEPCPREY